MRTETLRPPWKIKRMRFGFTDMVRFSGIEGTIRSTENGRGKRILNISLFKALGTKVQLSNSTQHQGQTLTFHVQWRGEPWCGKPWEVQKQQQLLCSHLSPSVTLWPGPNTSSFPWGGAWFCLGSKIRWWVVIVGRTHGEVDGHMDTSVNVLEQLRLQGWIVILVWKEVPLLPRCGEKQSFVSLWAESRTSFFSFTMASSLSQN